MGVNMVRYAGEASNVACVKRLQPMSTIVQHYLPLYLYLRGAKYSVLTGMPVIMYSNVIAPCAAGVRPFISSTKLLTDLHAPTSL